MMAYILGPGQSVRPLNLPPDGTPALYPRIAALAVVPDLQALQIGQPMLQIRVGINFYAYAEKIIGGRDDGAAVYRYVATAGAPVTIGLPEIPEAPAAEGPRLIVPGGGS